MKHLKLKKTFFENNKETFSYRVVFIKRSARKLNDIEKMYI